MSRIKLHFSYKNILEKHFHTKMRGYDPTDVDSFLDMIIMDYKTFKKTIQGLHDELRNAKLSKNDLYVSMNHKVNMVKDRNIQLLQQNKVLKSRLAQEEITKQYEGQTTRPRQSRHIRESKPNYTHYAKSNFERKEESDKTGFKYGFDLAKIKRHLQKVGRPTKQDLQDINNRMVRLEKILDGKHSLNHRVSKLEDNK